MSQNKALPYSIGSFLFSLVFIICGITQILAGITFLIVFKLKILWTASNIWIGVLNAILGSAWMKISKKKKLGLKIGISMGLTIWNVGNWLLMELGEWRSFFPENFLLIHEKDDIDLITAAYLSTMVPTVIAFVVALLACQYFSALLIIKSQDKCPEIAKHDSLQHEMRPTSSFTWVFNGSQCATPRRLLSNQASVHLAENSEVDPNTPNVFVHPFPKVTNSDGRNWENDPDFSSTNAAIQAECSCVRFSLNTDIAASKDDRLTSYTAHKSATIHKMPPISSLYPELREEITSMKLSNGLNNLPEKATNSTPFSNLSNRFGTTLEANVSQAECNFSTVPLHADTLIHLTQLELLARQWRFQFQYKALEHKAMASLARSKLNDA